MGKTWKDNTDKWRKNKDFRKKQQRTEKNKRPKFNKNQGYSPLEDSPEEHESFS